MLGVILLKVSKESNVTRLKSGSSTLIRFIQLRDYPKKNRLYGRIAIGFCLFLTFLYFYNFLLIKKPSIFKDLTVIHRRVEQVQEKTENGRGIISFMLNKKNFILQKDKGLISSYRLTNGDSVALVYMLDSNPRLTSTQKKRAIQLEVKKE